MAFVNLLQVVYPVGSCYFSATSISPASTIGGTWRQMTGGMLGLVGSVGIASAANNGGSREITVNQMPSHTHVLGRRQYGGSFELSLEWQFTNVGAGSGWLVLTGAGGDTAWGVPEIASTGGGQDYIPAHTAVYGWIRTA